MSFPELEGLAETYDDLLLDGEVVALDGGLPSFAALAERMHVSSARKAAQLATTRPVTFMAFDLLRLFGSDLTDQPWTARRELLERLELHSSAWQVPPVYDDGEELCEATRDQGLEGVVSKRRSSAYAAGRRSPDWRKSPHRATLSVVVGGWRPETGTTGRMGAVPSGHRTVREGGGCRPRRCRAGGHRGRPGREAAGTTAAQRLSLLQRVPREDAAGATWVEPRVVVEVQSLGRGSTGKLRQPAYLGIRTDLTPDDLHEVSDA